MQIHHETRTHVPVTVTVGADTFCGLCSTDPRTCSICGQPEGSKHRTQCPYYIQGNV